MTDVEFKKTLEYKDKKRVVNFSLKLTIVYAAIFVIVGMVAFLLLYSYSISIASIVLICVLIVYLSLDVPFFINYLKKRNNLKILENEMQNCYIFSCRLSEAVERNGSYSKYLICFNYNGIEKRLLSDWYYYSHNLDNKIIKAGYSEKLDKVLIIRTK